jgi:hypothetical protein
MSGEDAPRPYLENLIVPEIKTNKQTSLNDDNHAYVQTLVSTHTIINRVQFTVVFRTCVLRRITAGPRAHMPRSLQAAAHCSESLFIAAM